MNRRDLIRMGTKNLWRRKLRTFLTILGVIIGTASIVVMLSLGFGMQEAYKNQIAQMGSLTTINVHKSYDAPTGGNLGGRPKTAELGEKAIQEFKQLPGVMGVTPVVETYGTIKNGRYIAQVPFKGIDPNAMELFEFKVKEGRLLQSGDAFNVVFGGSMEYQFQDLKAMQRGRWVQPKVDLMKDRMTIVADDSYGYRGSGFSDGEKKVNYKEYKIKTAGVLEEGNWDTDWGIYMPLETVEKIIKDKRKAENQRPEPGSSANKGYEHVMIKVDDMKNVQAAQDSIKSMGFSAYSLNEWLDEMKKTAGIMQAVLGGIGAVSLLVAAIGITNTMVMSIYERTKEIGVMKVIGASLKDIKKLFLFESAIIGLLGGIIGVIFSEILSFIINKFGSSFLSFLGPAGEGAKISIIPIWLIFASMAFAALIGIISGYYPDIMPKIGRAHV